MADNTTTNAGTGGDTFATDDIGGVKWPRVKVTWGVDGAAVDASAASPLPVTSTVSNFPTNQAGAADILGTGSLTALNQAVTLTALNATSAGYIQLAGTWVGSIQLEGSLDNFATLTNLSTTQSGGAAPSTNPITANGFYRVLGVTNHIQIRARCSAFTSGTILVTLRASAANGIQPVISTNANGFLATTTIDQTTPGTTNRVDVGTINSVAPAFGTGVRGATVQRVTIATDDLVPVSATQVVGSAATRWFVQQTDGTNSPAIKAASTAAAFTDPALTVDPRPGGALVTASAALADAFANPTLGKQAVLPHVYNGSTWDLQRGMSGNLTTGDTGAKTATGNGATITNVGNKGIQIVLNMGAVTGTTPTFVMKVQGSVDGGTNWYDIPGATTASLVATGIWGIMLYPSVAVTAGTTVSGSTAGANGIIPRTWRVVWTIGGTTPSFTITSISYNYIPN